MSLVLNRHFLIDSLVVREKKHCVKCFSKCIFVMADNYRMTGFLKSCKTRIISQLSSVLFAYYMYACPKQVSWTFFKVHLLCCKWQFNARGQILVKRAGTPAQHAGLARSTKIWHWALKCHLQCNKDTESPCWWYIGAKEPEGKKKIMKKIQDGHLQPLSCSLKF